MSIRPYSTKQEKKLTSNRYFKKCDVIIYFFILTLIISIFIYGFFSEDKKAGSIEVYENGKLSYLYELQKDYRKIKLELKNGFEEIEIKDNKVRAIDADCSNKLCIRQGWIAQTGDMIICIPNKLVIKIVGNKQEVDSILK